jgi:hypothetical protein
MITRSVSALVPVEAAIAAHSLTSIADERCETMVSVDRRGPRIALAVALIALLLAAFAAAAGADSDPVHPSSAAILATVGTTPQGSPLAPGFVGVSMEYFAAHVYTGSEPNAVDPVVVQLLRNLAPGQPAVLRIGGDSSDWTWWPLRGVVPPDGIRYSLTRDWLRTTRALTQAVGAKLILGLNLAAGRPSLAAAEARALTEGIGRENIAAFELGNEPDLYARLPWYYTAHGRAIRARAAGYDVATFTQQFSVWRALTGYVPVVGPSFANLPWMSGLDSFLSAEPSLALATFHRYPLRGCGAASTDPTFPTESNLLSDYATTDLTQNVAQYAAIAHAHGLPFRVDEMNSVACSGRTGVSDTFASALWMLDTLFGLKAAGVDGVNVHTLPRSEYELFTVSHTGGWHAFVRPDYYGMLAFAHADPPGARLLPVTGSGGQVKIWADQSPDGSRRIVLINKDTVGAHLVLLAVPGAGTGTLQQLTAPNAAATGGVTLGGQTFGPSTTTGLLAGQPSTTTLHALAGLYSLTLPPGTAEILTLAG